MKFSILTLLMSCVVFVEANSYKLEVFETNNKKRTVVEDMSQFLSTNISRKSIPFDVLTCSKIYTVFKSDQKVLLSSDTFGPLPVTLKILDNENEEIYRQKNEHNLTSTFQINVEKLPSNSKLKVINSDGMPVFCIQLKVLEENS